MPILARLRTIGLRPETIEGTWAKPAATDATIVIYDPKMEKTVSTYERNPARASMSPRAPIPGFREATITFEMDIRGPDNIGETGHVNYLGIPECDIILRICGYKRTDTRVSSTIVSSSSSVITVASAVGFGVGDRISINPTNVGSTGSQLAYITAVDTGTGAITVANSGAHLAAEVVYNMDNVTTRTYTPCSTLGNGTQTVVATAVAADAATLSVTTAVGFAIGDNVRIDPGGPRDQTILVGFTDTVSDPNSITGTAHITYAHGNYSSTLSSGAAAAATTIAVTSATNLIVGDRILVGITHEVHYVTVITGTTITITPELTGAHLSGAVVMQQSVVQNLSSAHAYAASVELQDSLISHRLRGVRGNAEFKGVVGEPGRIAVTLRGVWHESIDIPAGTTFTPVFQEKNPVPFLSAGLLLNAVYSPVFVSASYQTGNELQIRQDANSAAGNISVLIVDRKPVGSFDPETVAEATYGFLAQWISGVPLPLRYQFGHVARNTVVITVPKAVYTKVADAERTKYATYDLEYTPVSTTSIGDDEISIAFS